MNRTLHAITGAFGYSGRHIATKLIATGHDVCSLTGHPNRPDPFDGRVAVRPLPFDDHAALTEVLRDVRVLYNTWWVRFDHDQTTHALAVERSRALIHAAAEAGVERFIHVSITNPALDSPLPYFKGKAQVEQSLVESGLSHAILRPAVLFGGRDVLLNNIAWLLRRFPVFLVARGQYGVQAIHVDDLADLAIQQGEHTENILLDAVGPEAPAFIDMVRLIASHVGRRAFIVEVPEGIVYVAARLLNHLVDDVVLTADEIAGLRANLLVSEREPTGATRLSEWLATHADTLGRTWASELGRHYR